jgi:cytoskeleton protein RodZ
MTNFGASFKKARESQGISLDHIAKQTRISTRFLSAIENEEFNVLPGGIFNRGFVRSYAEALGIDTDQAVAEYDRLVAVREPIDAPVATIPPPKAERHLYPIAIGVLAFAIAIFYIVAHQSGRTAEVSSSPTPPAVVQPAAPAAAPTPTATSEPSSTSTPAPTPQPPPEVAKEPAPAPAPPPPPAQALTLVIEVREQTWIKVTSDGNSVNPGEILEPGMTRKFTAENSINISIGNAAGLKLKINDKPIKPLGKSGEVRSVTITPANIKDFIG